MRQRVKGFTLFEILVAITLFSMIVGLIFGAFREITDSNEAIAEHSILYEMAQGCLSRITDDLHSLYVSIPPGYKKPDIDDPPGLYRVLGELTYAGNDSFSRLRFTSLAHLPMNGSQAEGIAEIVYYVQETEGDQYVLRRADNLFPYEDFEEKTSDPILCEKIREFSITYFDDENSDETTWDSDSRENDYATPRAISFSIGIGGDDEEDPLIFKTHVLLPMYRQKSE